MAKVTPDNQVQARADRYLEYLFCEWRRVPEVAQGWDEWDDYEQLDFIIEWPIREDRLYQLQQWIGEGLLRSDQRTRYQELMKLVAQHRPTLDRLLAD
jgi:hypothetical protein